MTTGINFWDGEVWAFIVTMFYLFAAMIVANTLRNTIIPLRKLMIPSSVLGGVILLIISFVYSRISGNALIPTATLEMLTYHGLGLGFVASTFKSAGGKLGKKRTGEIFDTGVTTVSSYLIQGVLGMAITLIAAATVMKDFFPAAGVLLPALRRP